MGKLLFLLFLFSFTAIGKEVIVKVETKILKPIKLNIKRDINFGNIIAGSKNIVAKNSGIIEVVGEGEISLLWKDDEKNEFQNISKDLKVKMKNLNNDIFYATLKKNGEMTPKNYFLNGESKIIEINGYIDYLDPKLTTGEYNGSVTIRAEYISK